MSAAPLEPPANRRSSRRRLFFTLATCAALAGGCKREKATNDQAPATTAPASTSKTADGWVVFTPSSRAFTVEAPTPLVEFPADPQQPSSMLYQVVATDGAYAFTIARWDIKANSPGAGDPAQAMKSTLARLARQYQGSFSGELQVLSPSAPTLLAGVIADAKLPGSEERGTVWMRWHLHAGVTHQLQAIFVDPAGELAARRFLDSFRLTAR